MHHLAFDTETELMEPGCISPRLVCVTTADIAEVSLFGRAVGPDMIASYLDDSNALIIGHNVAYDFGVIGAERAELVPSIFKAYREGRIRDTQIREQLIMIREGRAVDGVRYGLGACAEKYLGLTLDKSEDGPRLWYGRLLGKRTDLWTDQERDYATGDASSTLGVFHAQQSLPGNKPAPKWADSTISPDEVLQVRAAFIMHLMSMWGFRTDGERVAELRKNLEASCADAEARLLKFGLYKIAGTKSSPQLSKDMAAIKARIRAELGDRTPRTEKGAVSTAKETLQLCQDAGLQLLAEISNDQKKLSTFVPLVERGAFHPVTPAWNPLGARSGRTSCGSKTNPGNWQNLERSGEIRACVIAREGHIFGNADISQGELCTLAQTCLDWFGFSEMAEAIQAGRDLHVDFACSTPCLLQGVVTYEEAIKLLKTDVCEEITCGHDICTLARRVKDRRQFAKVGNFGLPGGLGPDTFVEYAWAMAKIRTTPKEGEIMKYSWLRKWPEMNPYFARIAALVEHNLQLEQPRSGRLRGGLSFCAAANSPFQGLLADAMKEAMWQIGWKCYMDEASPLFGARPILFLHDEFLIEVEESRASAATEELSRTMIASMRRFTPDLPVVAEPRLMRRWYKGAKEIRSADGLLLPWEPKPKKEKRAA